jgi:hypothetical protein
MFLVREILRMKKKAPFGANLALILEELKIIFVSIYKPTCV